MKWMGPRTVLVVDDDARIVRMVCVKLERHGYRTLTASNGQEALELMGQRAPDLLILDVMMPVMDGLDLVRALKASPALRDIPIFILTARGQVADKELAYALGIEEYIIKPFSPSAVLRRINEYFAGLES